MKMVDKKNIPAHIAIIMDGNGRWAKKHGLPRSEGHRRGMTAVREIIKAASELGVKFLTLYAFSSENWKRSKEEVDFLMQMCQDMINRELPYMMKNKIRLKHVGRKGDLPASLQHCIQNAEKLTVGNDSICVQLAFNYGSRMEIIEAVQKIIEDVKSGKADDSQITERLISDGLYTKGVPDPDLLIRTSGEQRISNFLLWQLCYTEFYFTKTLWPDFKKREFLRAVNDYQKRRRRFGGLDG